MVVLFYSNLNNLHQCVLKLEQNLHILEKLKSAFMSKNSPPSRLLFFIKYFISLIYNYCVIFDSHR